MAFTTHFSNSADVKQGLWSHLQSPYGLKGLFEEEILLYDTAKKVNKEQGTGKFTLEQATKAYREMYIYTLS